VRASTATQIAESGPHGYRSALRCMRRYARSDADSAAHVRPSSAEHSPTDVRRSARVAVADSPAAKRAISGCSRRSRRGCGMARRDLQLRAPDIHWSGRWRLFRTRGYLGRLAPEQYGAVTRRSYGPGTAHAGLAARPPLPNPWPSRRPMDVDHYPGAGSGGGPASDFSGTSTATSAKRRTIALAPIRSGAIPHSSAAMWTR
jgi:hypothetical protein